MANDRLNVKQEKFIQGIINGLSQRQAYKEAYNANYDDNAIDIKASQLFNRDKVQIRYRELLKELEDESIMSAQERMRYLTQIINNQQKEKGYTMFGQEYEKEANFKTKLDAIDILNKMSGDYKTRIDANVNTEIKVRLTDD